jgi:tetratricopeptide (TPR) repeat protein
VPDDADRDLEQELQEQEAERLVLAAQLLLRQGRTAELQHTIEQLKERAPDSAALPELQWTWARHLLTQGRADDLEAALSELRDREPGNSSLCELEGDLHRLRGQRSAAQEAYKRAFELDATNAEAEQKYAELALSLGEEDRARKRQEQLFEEPTKHPPQPRNPLLSAFYSCIFPGFGQLYNRDHEKGLVLLGVAAIILMLLVNAMVIGPLQKISHEVKDHRALAPPDQFATWREHLGLMPGWHWVLVVLGILCFSALQVYSIVDAYRTARQEVKEAAKLGI